MKRIVTYTVLIIILTTLGIVGYLNKPSNINIPIIGKTYYKYNYQNGNYETFILTNKELFFDNEEYKNCKTYTYDEITEIIKLDCGKAFRIIISSDNNAFSISGTNEYFFMNKEDSYNKEFNDYFRFSKEEYSNEGLNKLKTIEINYSLIKELLNKELSYVYIIPNNCKDKCIIFNQTVLDFSDKIHYLDINKLTKDEVKEFSSIYNEYNQIINKENPVVLVINNKKISTLEITFNGFDSSKYINYGGNNE